MFEENNKVLFFAECPAPTERNFATPSTRMSSVRSSENSLAPSTIRRRTTYSGQELLPGIPDQVTVQNIATKLKWETCNELQLVSQGWRDAIHSRTIYDTRQRSNFKEAFLVLAHFNDVGELILDLYSCEDGTVLQLPPPPVVPTSTFVPLLVHACVCLDGRVYLWVGRKLENWVRLCILDLAGDRKWTERKRIRFPLSGNSYWGVLDGKIYRFQGAIDHFSGVLEGGKFQNPVYDLARPVPIETLPQTYVYDLAQDVWSLTTPQPSRSADPGRYLASLSAWTKKQVAADPSGAFVLNGRYEPFFSEWRRWKSSDSGTASTIVPHVRNALAAQVHCKRAVYGRFFIKVYEEILFFFQGKLLKYVNNTRYRDDAVANFRVYDMQKNTWRKWKVFSADFPHLDKTGYAFWIKTCTSTDNMIWAMVDVWGNDSSFKALVKASVSPDDPPANKPAIKWIDTGYYFQDNKNGSPIYIWPIYF